MHIRIDELRNRKNTALDANAAHGLTADELAQFANFDPAKMHVVGDIRTLRPKPSAGAADVGETLAISDNTPFLPLLAKRPSAAGQGRAEHARLPNLEGSFSEHLPRHDVDRHGSYGVRGRDTITISDRRALQPRFPDHLPRTPYCSNSLPDGVFPREKSVALQHRYLSVNSTHSLEWLTFDVDRSGSYYADSEANLPPANIVAVNPMSGRGHLSYLLAKPVHKYDAARDKPREYYAGVQRGMTNRLGSDKTYTGLITKNPVHEDWAVEWRRNDPYTLDELNDWLFDADKRFDVGVKGDPILYGFSRNVTVFDDLRTFAYREVLKFKNDGRSSAEFTQRLLDVAFGLNRQFPQALPVSEIRATVKSVSQWTWKRFSPAQFSRIQSHRGKAGMAKRWAGHKAESTVKPWEAMGISRSTFYRRKKSGLII